MNVLKAETFGQRAVMLADWFERGQIKDGGSADHGRFVFSIPAKARKPRVHYTTNWTTGMTCIAMQMAWQRTKDERYLKAAQRGIDYLKSLQVLAPLYPRAIGMFLEVTPQNNSCHPRDSLSAAWALLHMHMETGDKVHLWRVLKFAEWFTRHAVRNDYPAWTFWREAEKDPYWQLGSFHGGSPLFLFDLYAVTGQVRWKTAGLRMCDRWLALFPKRDGSIRIELDARTGRDVTGKSKDKGVLGWQEMHRWNDDFTSLALMRAYTLTRQRKYLDAVIRYMGWVLARQRPDGAFGADPISSAAASLIIELLDLAAITGEEKYHTACLRSVPHFLSLQETRSRNPALQGGFYCVDDRYAHSQRDILGARTSAYALAALLKLEGQRTYRGYSV